MNRVIEILENRIDHLENRSLRSSLIVDGLEEDETSESLERAVNKKKIMQPYLNHRQLVLSESTVWISAQKRN